MKRASARSAALAVLLSAIAASPVAAAQEAPATAGDGTSLQSIVTDPDLRRLYELGGWRKLWTPEQASSLADALAMADRHAISAKRMTPNIQAADTPDARDLELSRAALAYGRALAQGTTDPTVSHEIFTLGRNSVDLVGGLHAALTTRSGVGTWLAGLAPSDPEYQALSAAYLEERAAIGSPRVRLRDGPAIRLGARDPRLAELAEALTTAGFPVPHPGRTFDAAFEAAVRAFQKEAGLVVDGVVGPATISALNTGPFERARQLAVNLERRRWLARDPAPTRIDVNIATARMVYRHEGTVAWESRVVAGATQHETPQLGERLDRLVVNPPWYVPDSIAQAEILPKGSEYLEANDMYLDNGRVIQRPGPEAALGQVKFDMQNRYAIYLHDTPSKALFEASERHRSHGCVRVEDAVGFARMLATQRGKGEEFDAALASGDTTVVDLGAPIAVRLMYHTAVLENGSVRFRPDVYGWDDAVAAELGLPGEGVRTRAAATAVLGP